MPQVSQMPPPGVWVPGHAVPPAHDFARSRSPRRSSAADLTSIVSKMTPAEFRTLFNALPADLRSVAFDAPDDVITDIKSISDKDTRMSMCKRINEMRRERIRALATPQAGPFYEEDSFKIVPMSRVVERHFWDLFHKLPISTTDATKWKSVLKHLDSCPEKAKTAPNSRDVEWASGELLEGALPLSSSPHTSHGSSLESLRAMALGSPSKPAIDENSPDFHDWVKRRVDTDTADLSMTNFELDTKVHRFAGRKTSAAKALMTLTPLDAMSELYKTVFRIYLRKLERVVPKLGARSKENTCLGKLLDALNVSPDEHVATLLARLRTLDIIRRPACLSLLPPDCELSAALRVALDLVLLLRFRVFCASRFSWDLHLDLLKLAGSLWLMCLQSVSSRRNLRLLKLIGRDPWEHGWLYLEQVPCLYLIFPFPLRHSSLGPLIYVGETINFGRRMREHALRIICRDGATQQPFFTRWSGTVVMIVLSCLPP